MTIPMPQVSAPPRQALRSAGAVFAGFVAVFILSLGTDQVLHVLQVYPPWGQPMYEPSLNLLALAYRIPFNVLGSYITARLAPHSPMKHVWIGAAIGFVLCVLGAIAALSASLGPSWYPILLALSVAPCAWIGGTLDRRSSSNR